MSGLTSKKVHNEVLDFTCGNASIDLQIQHAYFQSDLGITYAYEVSLESHGVVGYYCLCMHEIDPTALPAEVGDIDIGRKFSFYAVEIKFLAVKKSLQGHHIGTSILETLIRQLYRDHKSVPFRFIFIDALSDADIVSWYQRHGFQAFTDTVSEECVKPMYLDLGA